ncbi:fibronectin-binding protein A-like [Bombyx mori]|uniref:fibronectin-binding protein A-like n=1 Tax=Bombyx mori TaxID=7091 RepID=UPI002ED6A363
MKEYKKMRDLFINSEGRTGTSNLDLNATMENFVKKFGIANIPGYNSTTVNNSVQTKALYGTLSGRNLNLTENKPKALDNRTENSSRSESPRPDQLNFANPDLTTTPPVPQLGSPNMRPVPPGYSNAPKAPSPFIPHPNSYHPYGVPIVPDLPLPPGHPDGPKGEPNSPVANQTATDTNYEIGSLLHHIVKPKTTTQNPFISELYGEMKTKHNGYLTTFLLKFFEIVASRRREDALPLVLAFAAAIDGLYETRQLLGFGEPLHSKLLKNVHMMVGSPIDVVQSYAALTYNYLVNRGVTATDEVNAIIDYADSLYEENDGKQLFKVQLFIIFMV